MSIMHFDTTSSLKDDSIIVQLLGGIVSAFDPTYVFGGWEVRSNGKVYKDENGSKFYSHDWIIPLSEASSDYKVRANITGGTLKAGSSALNTWLDINTTRLWRTECSAICVDFQDLTIDIRYLDGTDPRNNVSSLFDSASCMASAVYDINLEAT